MYVDEVGNGDLKGAKDDDNIRYLSLTGIITSRSIHDRFMTPRMEELTLEFFEHAPNKPLILHRRDIVNRTGPFSVLQDPAIRAQFDDRLFAYLTEQKYLVVTVIIDKREHLTRYTAWRYDPYHYCLHCLVERYVIWLNRHGYRGDVAIEARYPFADRRLKKSYTRLYHEGTTFITPKAAQKALTSREIKLVGKKENWAGLQLADLIAHPSFRAMRREREGLYTPDDFGSRVAELLVASKLARHPQKGTIPGYGRKWLPS